MSNDDVKKSKIGRPPVDTMALTVRMLRGDVQDVDDWRRKQEDLPNRPEAIRRLVRLALSSLTK